MNRSSHTYGRQSRRVRLWLHPDTWGLIDQAARGLMWDDRAPTIIESILEAWAKAQLDRASRAATYLAQLTPLTTNPAEAFSLAHAYHSPDHDAQPDDDTILNADAELPLEDEGPGW